MSKVIYWLVAWGNEESDWKDAYEYNSKDYGFGEYDFAEVAKEVFEKIYNDDPASYDQPPYEYTLFVKRLNTNEVVKVTINLEWKIEINAYAEEL